MTQSSKHNFFTWNQLIHWQISATLRHSIHVFVRFSCIVQHMRRAEENMFNERVDVGKVEIFFVFLNWIEFVTFFFTTWTDDQLCLVWLLAYADCSWRRARVRYYRSCKEPPKFLKWLYQNPVSIDEHLVEFATKDMKQLYESTKVRIYQSSLKLLKYEVTAEINYKTVKPLCTHIIEVRFVPRFGAHGLY